ncbi:GNAT family N-acetyltransferase [Bosea caraganae]|nr:GNAT family N-acetyltransferase [Bosea caraganae]
MQLDLAYAIQRMGLIAARPGNPFGIAIQDFGQATALAASQLPSPRFNRLVGLTPDEALLLPDILAWFAAQGVSPRIEIRPGSLDAALADALARAGFRQTGFHASLVAQTTATPALDDVIRPVETPAIMDEFLDTYLAGWGFPSAIHEGAKGNMRGWLGLPGWHLYLAQIDGRPAATAILFLDGEVGYLADACVHPAYRGRRLHAALLAHRQNEAVRLGAGLLCGQADFASTSHRNMERSGLRLLHTQSEWLAK